jgi:Ca2+-binding RTX toxin-like protein
MTAFVVTNGGFDVDAFELAQIPITTAETIGSTAGSIFLARGDEVWEVIGFDFAPVEEGALPTTGFVQEVRKTSPTQSFVTFAGEPVPLEDFLAAVEANATDALLDGVFADADVLIGDDEADVLSGRDGDDTVIGGGGDDELRGGAGADRLFGDDGADTLVGDAGDDLMDGGAGGDVFVFDPTDPDEGDDTVLGLDLAEDRVQLAAEAIRAATDDVTFAEDATPADLAAGLDASAQWTLGASAAGAAVLTHPTGTVTLADVAAADLPVATFAELFAAGVLVIEEPAPPPAANGSTEPGPETGEPAPAADTTTDTAAVPDDGGAVA